MNNTEKLKRDFWEKIRPPRTLEEQLAERAAEHIDSLIVKGLEESKAMIRKYRPEMTEEEIEKAIYEIFEK